MLHRLWLPLGISVFLHAAWLSGGGLRIWELPEPAPVWRSRVRLRARPVPLAGRPQGSPKSPRARPVPRPASSTPVRALPQSPRSGPAPRLPAPARPVEAAPLAYPQGRRKPALRTPASVVPGIDPEDRQGELVWLEPPVLIKGPQRIPIPAFLQNRDGRFRLTLLCRIGADGSSQVEVMEGTGALELDQSVAQSFAHLPWYPAQLRGASVQVAVRLTIETEWEAGQTYIDWGGRVPHQDPIAL